MAVTGTPHAGHNRSHARRKKRKLTKAAERAAFPVVLAIKSVTAKLKVGRRASQHRRNRKMKWKQKARKVAAKASRGAVPQSAEDAEAGAVHETTGRGPICKMHEPLSLSSSQSGSNANKVLTVDNAQLQEAVKENLSNPYTDVIEEAKIADPNAAQLCQTAQHDIKEEPTVMPASAILPKTDVSAPVFETDSGQEVPLASHAVKQEATCFSSCSQSGVAASFWQDDSQAVSGCNPLEATEEAITDRGDMLAAAAVHSIETASPSMTAQDKAQGVQNPRVTLLGAPTTEPESGADPTFAKEVASHVGHVGAADCPCQHGTLAAPSVAETVAQLPQTKASPRKGSSSVSTSSLAAMLESLPPVTDLSFGHGF